MDCKDIICNPQHVWLITLTQPCQFVRNQMRLSPPVRVPKDLMAAPLALIRTPARRYERDRPHAVMFTPCLYILGCVDGLSGRPGLGVNVRNLRARSSPANCARRVAEGNAINFAQIRRRRLP